MFLLNGGGTSINCQLGIEARTFGVHGDAQTKQLTLARATSEIVNSCTALQTVLS